jgi:tetratricopeptide (TPR) repeat protein
MVLAILPAAFLTGCLCAAAVGRPVNWKEGLLMAENAYLRGRYQEGADIASQSLDLAKNTYGSTHPAVAECYNTLAHFYRALGWHQAAESMHRGAMEINEEIHGKLSRQFGRDCCSLCTLFLIFGRYPEASQNCQEAVSVFKACIDGDCPYPGERFASRDELRKFLDKPFTFRNEWRMFEECSGPDRCALGIAYYHMGRIANERGNLSEAIKYMDQAVELLDDRHTCREWAFAVAKGGLAEIHMLAGHEAEAIELKTQAMELADRAAGLDEPAVVFMLIRVVAAFTAMGKHKEIEKESKRLLSFLRQKAKGDDEYRLSRYLDELKRIYKIRKLQPEAEKILKDFDLP